METATTTTVDDPSLDLAGIGRHLRVGFWRARRWRLNDVHDNGLKRIKLCPPDVLDDPPRWRQSTIEQWAAGYGLWPPRSGQKRCSECGGFYAVYQPSGVLYAHGWTVAEGTNGEYTDPCRGSLRPPAQEVL